MGRDRRRLVMAAIGFSILIVVLTLVAVSLLSVDVDARDWAIAIATAVVVGGFLTLLVMRRGFEAAALERRAQDAHVPEEGLRPEGHDATVFEVAGTKDGPVEASSKDGPVEASEAGAAAADPDAATDAHDGP